ncbi:MAG: hypothetical protein N3D75_04725 [Candidatus Aenigmarchaeota archaeon]|nr:hypothetical protein [Candidatus Aenigmarchaeota archaeon]
MTYIKLYKINYTNKSQSEKNQHKIPVEKDWQNNIYTAEDAEKWVLEGFGVGYNIAKSPHKVAVIDIDCKSDDADYIAKKLGEAGALVCETSRGYHIFVKQMDGMPNDSKGVVIRVDDHYEECEFYSGSSARNIVLPIINTPRANYFGGMVLYADGKVVGEPVTIWTFEEYLESLKEIHGWCLYNKNAKPGGPPTLRKETIEKWNSILGCDFRTCTKEKVCEVMANTPNGSRNDTMLSLSLIWVWRGFGDWEPFIQACRTAWYDEPRYVDKNVMEALKGAEKWIQKIKRYTSKPIFSAGSFEEEAQIEQSEQEESIIEKVMRVCFNNEAKYKQWMGQNYILHNGYAYTMKNVMIKALQNGIKLSEPNAKALFETLSDYCEEDENAIIIRPGSIDYKKNLGFVVPVQIEGEKGAIISGNGEMKFVKVGDLPNVYFMKETGFRKISKEHFENPSECLNELVSSLQIFFESYSDNEIQNAYISAVLASATPAARAVLFILGESGAGKSTLSVFIQKMINNTLAIAENDGQQKDIYPVIVENRVVGFEETETLTAPTLALLKQATTFGSRSIRKFYGQTETVKFEFENNFVIASTAVDVENQDILRRSICIRLKIQKRPQKTESEVMEGIQNSLPHFIVGYMFLCKDFVSYSNKNERFSVVMKKDSSQDLPQFLKNSQKIDVAYAYWYFCKKFGVSEKTAATVWDQVRNVNLMKMLGVWGPILEKYEVDPQFRQKAEQGMFAKQLLEETYGHSDTKKSTKLSKAVDEVKPIFLERGIEIIVEDKRNEKGHNLKFYRLKKINDTPPTPSDDTPTDESDNTSPSNADDTQSSPSPSSIPAPLSASALPSTVSVVSEIPMNCRKKLFEDYMLSEYDLFSLDPEIKEKTNFVKTLAEFVLFAKPTDNLFEYLNMQLTEEEKHLVIKLYKDLKEDLVSFYNKKFTKSH